MGLWNRVLTGDGLRRTRLHTYTGNLVSLAGCRYLPRSLFSAFLLKLGRRQAVPWLGYRAVRRVEGVIQPEWRVLEFGSGMSTIWLASLCRELVSVENDPTWHEQVQGLLAARGIRGVDHRLQDHSRLDDLEDASFDLALVDGPRRGEEMETALRKTKPTGFILLDNSDVPQPDYQRARASLLDAVGRRSEQVEVFDDFYPFQFQVNESILVSLG